MTIGLTTRRWGMQGISSLQVRGMFMMTASATPHLEGDLGRQNQGYEPSPLLVGVIALHHLVTV